MVRILQGIVKFYGIIMKRYLIATFILSVLLPLGASAQWYLFPGSRPKQDSTSVKPRSESFVPIGLEEEIPVEEEAAVTRISLILPFRSSATPNANFLDFYSGVLIAANSLSSGERHYELSVFDSTEGLPSGETLEKSDLIIGPVSYDDVQRIPRSTRK